MSDFLSSLSNFCLDLRGTPCPINFVRTKLRLEQMNQGEVLEVWLDGGEPIEQVPDSLITAGYVVMEKQAQEDFWKIWIKIPS
jgi:TusA-related sulfurtransferase